MSRQLFAWLHRRFPRWVADPDTATRPRRLVGRPAEVMVRVLLRASTGQPAHAPYDPRTTTLVTICTLFTRPATHQSEDRELLDRVLAALSSPGGAACDALQLQALQFTMRANRAFTVGDVLDLGGRAYMLDVIGWRRLGALRNVLPSAPTPTPAPDSASRRATTGSDYGTS